jgi:hypothetical protein
VQVHLGSKGEPVANFCAGPFREQGDCIVGEARVRMRARHGVLASLDAHEVVGNPVYLIGGSAIRSLSARADPLVRLTGGRCSVCWIVDYPLAAGAEINSSE